MESDKLTQHTRNCWRAYAKQAMCVASLVLLAACSNSSSGQDAVVGKVTKIGNDVVIDGKDWREGCGLETSSPQVYIFDRTGALVSTELGYSPGAPLNIEAGKPGRGFENLDKLKKCMVTRGVEFERWQKCGADYCVTRILPDASVGHCPYCDLTQASLDAFFSSRGAKVAYHSIFFK